MACRTRVLMLVFAVLMLVFVLACIGSGCDDLVAVGSDAYCNAGGY